MSPESHMITLIRFMIRNQSQSNQAKDVKEQARNIHVNKTTFAVANCLCLLFSVCRYTSIQQCRVKSMTIYYEQQDCQQLSIRSILNLAIVQFVFHGLFIFVCLCLAWFDSTKQIWMSKQGWLIFKTTRGALVSLKLSNFHNQCTGICSSF